MPLALLALAVGAFGIGSTEFVIVGLLPEVAADLGASVPSAGLLVSGYALSVVVLNQHNHRSDCRVRRSIVADP